MKVIIALTATLFAMAHGDSACAETGTTSGSLSSAAMWTTGVGSSTCTAYGSCWVKGSCSTNSDQYTINIYSDSGCTTAASTTTSPALSGCSTVYAGSSTCSTASCATTITQDDGKATTAQQLIDTTYYKLTSCGACPGTSSVNGFTLILSFFMAVFGYILFVCFGMFIFHNLGYKCN